MKKILCTLLVICVSFSAMAQKGNPEKSAKNNTEKMTAELSLKKEESAKVYDIMFAKFTRNVGIKERNSGDKAAIKKALGQSNKTAQKELTAVLGEDKMAQWKAYLAANKKKK